MPPETQEAPKSKKWLYIVGGIIVVLVLGKFTMGGFGGSMPGLDRNLDGSATYSSGDGSVTVGGNKLPSDWPSDAPTYRNVSIQSSLSSNSQAGESGSVVVFTTTDSLQAVIDFYKRELPAKGWTIAQTMTSGETTVLAATKDARTFGVYMTDSGDGKVSVSVSISIP